MRITVVSTLIAGLLLSFGSAAEPGRGALKPDRNKEKKVYIVQLAEEPLAAYGGHIPGLAATRPRASRKLDPQSS